MGLALCAVGLGVSAYLSADAFDPSVGLACPSTRFVDCVKVTASPYSHIVGVPVAVLGVAWFAVMAALIYFKADSYVLPFWSLGIVFVGYLIFTEVFLVHAICVYCTVVHITVAALVYPATKLSLSGD